MSFAIFETNGKQYKVSVGDEIYIDTLKLEPKASITFDKVLMLNDKIGKPYVIDATISATIVKHGKEKKLDIIHHISQKHHTKRMGHRQGYTKIKITKI
jgi:large subunit ribosomal protein L21